jgi:hypothetical protein
LTSCTQSPDTNELFLLWPGRWKIEDRFGEVCPVFEVAEREKGFNEVGKLKRNSLTTADEVSVDITEPDGIM